MWHDLATAFRLMLLIEGILPFIDPKLWRKLLMVLVKEIDDSTTRIIGLGSMLAGIILLWIIN